MAIRQRTTKLVARRHDLNYFKRMSPLRAWQWWLAAVALVGAGLWFGGSTLVQGSSALSAGPLSASHAVMGQRCELCHVPVVEATSWTPSFGMRRKVPDSACLACHIAEPHHPMETADKPTCGSCHVEHAGAMHLAAVADSSCTQCHAKLEPRDGVLRVAASVKNFGNDHPEFRPLREAADADRSAAFALRFNHAGHMKAGLTGPHGVVTLECSTCHVAVLNANGRSTGVMAPVNFEKSCRTCHSLQFDAHVAAEAPHDTPEKVRAFVAQAVASFAQEHPEVVDAELKHWPAEAPLPGKTVLPASVVLPPPHTRAEWVSNRTAHAEMILWRGKCGVCHRDLNPESRMPYAPSAIPLMKVEASAQPQHWFTAAVFSHAAHDAVKCEECHAKALTSSNGTDVLMPEIATCRRCHDGRSSPEGPALKAGHAESGCFLCHLYHGRQKPGLTPAGFKLEQMAKR
ncbi:MAG: cytochrome c3 family protein [Acidobacteriota bacterium]